MLEHGWTGFDYWKKEIRPGFRGLLTLSSSDRAAGMIEAFIASFPE